MDNCPERMDAGDFNQWKVSLEDLSDMSEVRVGNTRKDKAIDRIFTNMHRKITESGTLAPLTTEEDIQSDHRVAFCVLEVPRREVFRWEIYTYRHYDQAAVERFKDWIVMHEWREVLGAVGPEDKADAYQATLTKAIDDCFPLKTRKKKSTDLPWMTDGIRKQIKDRKELFAREGGIRTDAWKVEKKRTADLIKKSKRGYMDVQKGHILAEDANRNFFKHVKNFSRLEKPPQFDVRDLREFEGKEDEEIAEELAGFLIGYLGSLAL